MANRFNDRDMEERNYFPSRGRDRERFRSEQGQGGSQESHNFGGQEESEWYETSQSPYQQYGRGQEGRSEGRRMGSDIEGSRFAGRQERFGNQEMNRGFARGGERQSGRGSEQWEDSESARWREPGSMRSGFGPNQFSGERESEFRQTQGFSQGFGQGQFGEGQESWGTGGRQQGRFGQQKGFGQQGITGRFAGRGPKGYRRSDERILEDINEKLTDDADIDASEIEVEVTYGEVILLGTVDDRESKRRAEDLAESVSGVLDVQNQLKVRNRNQAGSGSDQQTLGLGSTGVGTGGNEGMTSQTSGKESSNKESLGKDKGNSNKDK